MLFGDGMNYSSGYSLLQLDVVFASDHLQ